MTTSRTISVILLVVVGTVAAAVALPIGVKSLVRPASGPGDSRDSQREAMVRNQLVARSIRNKRVLDAMRKVPRHEFVPAASRVLAYIDSPLPIGHRQTISQPYIVAFMTEVVKPQPKHRVLEIGTGSGYQAAVLAELVGEVYTIELIPELADQARARLKRLDYRNIHVRTGDGYLGWPDAAPFDSIVVTCGAEHVPEPLFAQLKPGGKMVIPVGPVYRVQMLRLVEKGEKGERRSRDILPVRFVPLRRGDQPADKAPEKEGPREGGTERGGDAARSSTPRLRLEEVGRGDMRASGLRSEGEKERGGEGVRSDNDTSALVYLLRPFAASPSRPFSPSLRLSFSPSRHLY